MRVTHGTPHRNQPCALAVGNFDGVHVGHQAMLTALTTAAERHGVEPAVLTFEPHPREFFDPAHAPARLSSLREKLAMLATFHVKHTHVARFDTAFAGLDAEAFVTTTLVKGMQACYVLVGDDFRFGSRRGGDYAFLESAGRRCGFETEALTTVRLHGERVSSTAVRAALAQGDLKYARQLLGRPYTIHGRVERGQQLGRQLGFPTANVRLNRKPALSGIFVVEVEGISNDPHPGVASLGWRPTVSSDLKPVLEVFLLDFNASLYGRRIGVRFLHKLRDEEKYPDLNSLYAQIRRDVEHTRAWFAQSRPA